MSGQSASDSGCSIEAECSEFLSRAQQGDLEAPDSLLQLYRERLLRMVRFRIDNRLSQRIDASDVVQEATMEAAKRLPNYLEDPSMDFYVWLRWITRDRLIDLHRQQLGTQKRGDGRDLSIDESCAEQSAVALADMLVSQLSSPSNAMERKQNHEAVRQAIQTLNSTDREILELRHFEQLSTRQAAEVLGLSKSGASKRYVLALKNLKVLLRTVLPDYE